jgi:hypothetical protein
MLRAMRNDPEKRLIRGLEALMRRAPERLITSRVHRWRGRKFVVKLRVKVAVFATTNMLGEPINANEPIGFYESDFGFR